MCSFQLIALQQDFSLTFPPEELAQDDIKGSFVKGVRQRGWSLVKSMPNEELECHLRKVPDEQQCVYMEFRVTELYSPVQTPEAHTKATNVPLTNSLLQNHRKGPAAGHVEWGLIPITLLDYTLQLGLSPDARF